MNRRVHFTSRAEALPQPVDYADARLCPAEVQSAQIVAYTATAKKRAISGSTHVEDELFHLFRFDT